MDKMTPIMYFINSGLYGCDEDGTLYSLKYNKKNIVNVKPNKQGYLMVKMRDFKIVKSFSYHRVVYFFFNREANQLLEINHVDGNKTNNRLDNLELVTHEQNMAHASINGLMNTPKRVAYLKNNRASAKLGEVDIIAIRRLLDEKVSGKTIAKLFKVSTANISFIKNKKTWNDPTTKQGA